MTAKENNQRDAGPDAFAEYGKAPIFAALVIGGALMAGLLMMWQTHNRKVQQVEMSKIEEAARVELRAAYMEMRSLKPERALERTGRAHTLIASLNAKLAPDYAPLKISLLLVEAESLFMKDCARHANAAEEKFDQALRFMNFASGEMWQFGMLGRARARIEQEKYREAAADLDILLDRNPSFGSAYYWRSTAREHLDDETGAREDENKARALDSWPPLRDYMQASCVWSRDIIHKPKVRDSAETVEGHSITPFFIPGAEPVGETGDGAAQ